MTKPICPLLSKQKSQVECLEYNCAIFNRRVKMCGFAFVPLVQKESIEDYEHVKEI